jgi:hypothetical protein
LTPETLVDAVFDYLTHALGMPVEQVIPVLLDDYLASGARARPQCLAQERLLLGGDPSSVKADTPTDQPKSGLRERQDRHTLRVS